MYPSTATTLGSLMVQARPMRSPRCAGRTLDEAGEALGRVGCLPPTACGEPLRGGEVMERNHRLDAALPAPGAHPAIVVEGGKGPLALRRLDAAPLQGEPIGAEPQFGHQVDVLGPAVERVTGVTAWLDAAGLGSCSQAHQSLFVFPPSIWWAAVAAPHTKPAGNLGGAGPEGSSARSHAGQRSGIDRAVPVTMSETA